MVTQPIRLFNLVNFQLNNYYSEAQLLLNSNKWIFSSLTSSVCSYMCSLSCTYICTYSYTYCTYSCISSYTYWTYTCILSYTSVRIRASYHARTVYVLYALKVLWWCHCVLFINYKIILQEHPLKRVIMNVYSSTNFLIVAEAHIKITSIYY